MNPTDKCPDCGQITNYDARTGDFDNHNDYNGNTCVGSGTPAPAGMFNLPPMQGLPANLQALFNQQGISGTPPTQFDPPVKKRKSPSKVEQLAKALMGESMAPPAQTLNPPKVGEACSKHGLAAQVGVACGFCQMDYDAQQPVEFRADHNTTSDRHMDGSPCTKTDQCPWSFASWNALNNKMGERELLEVADRLSGVKQVSNLSPGAQRLRGPRPPEDHRDDCECCGQYRVLPFHSDRHGVDYCQECYDTGCSIGADGGGCSVVTNLAGPAPVVNTTGLPDDVARSLGLL